MIGGMETERNNDEGRTTERDGKEMQRSIRANTDGFGGLVVSILVTGTRVRGFKPG